MLPSNAAVRKSEFSWATGRYPGTCARAQWGDPFARARPNWGLERRNPNAGKNLRQQCHDKECLQLCLRLLATSHQCARKSASTVAIPAIIEPVIAVAAGMALGNSRLIKVATKIAATGRTITK